MWDVVVCYSLSVPSLASVSTISLPMIPVCALTLWIEMYVGSNKFGVLWLL